MNYVRRINKLVHINNSEVELLAPVGSMESLHAAVENGANAVYLGGKMFNARQYASNFDMDELEEAVKYAHLREVKVYITVNILLRNDELEKALDYIRHLYNIDVDGLIVQDLGLVYLIKSLFPNFPLHGSTQMTVNNLEGILFLEEIGFERVVLARELSIEQIKYIKDRCSVELEGFIHGALCVCYSGQCLMSSIIGGRSGNRGTCAQPCRMPYSIVNLKDEKIVNDQFNKVYLMSPKDLCTIDSIEDVVNSGLKSLKVEGRMKRPEYVALVINKYRKAIDKGSSNITKEDKKELFQIFNRGFTKGYILGDFGKDFISLDRPDNRGVYIGKVVNIENNNIKIRLEDDVDVGDGLELKTVDRDYVGIIVNTTEKKGNILVLDNIKKIKMNSPVYKSSSIALLNRASESFAGEKRIKYPINMNVKIIIEKPATLTISDGINMVNTESEVKVEKGKRIFLTKERIIEQLDKLGDEPYYIDNIDINLEEGSFLSISDINGLRRMGIEKLNELRANINNRNPINEKELYERKSEFFNYKVSEKYIKEKKLSIKVSNLAQFKSINLKKLDRIYLGFDEDIFNCIREVKNADKEVYFYTDKIYSDVDLHLLGDKLEAFSGYLDGISVSNIGTLHFIKNNFNLKIHGDIGLNVFNSYTAKLLHNYGVDSVTLSPELTLNQIENVNSRLNIPFEAIGYGYLPLMVMKYCPMSLIKGCQDANNCGNCKFSEGYGIKDRKGIIFPFKREGYATTVYNSVPLVMIEDMNSLFEIGVEMVRVDFTHEDKDILAIQEAYYDRLHGNLDKCDVAQMLEQFKQDKGFTKGHYFRGVL